MGKASIGKEQKQGEVTNPKAIEPTKLRQSKEVESSNKLTEIDHKLLGYCLSKVFVAKLAETTKEDRALLADKVIDVPIGEFAKVFKYDRQSSYEQLMKAVENLGKKYCMVEPGVLDEYAGSKRAIKVFYISSIYYAPKESLIGVKLGVDVIHLLAKIAKGEMIEGDKKLQYICYDIATLANLDDIYSILLYKYCLSRTFQAASVDKKKQIWGFTLSVEALSEVFQLDGKYKEYRDFRRYVLNPAVIKVCRNTKYTVSYIEDKEGGRSVKKVNFTITA